MSTETYSKSNKIDKVNVNVLKSRITSRIKKEKFHSRIILFSFLISICLIGYFVV